MIIKYIQTISISNMFYEYLIILIIYIIYTYILDQGQDVEKQKYLELKQK